MIIYISILIIFRYFDNTDTFFDKFMIILDIIDKTDYNDFYQIFYTLLQQHPILEIDSSDDDILLRNFYKVFRKLLTENYEDDNYIQLYELLISNVLFRSPNYVKCKSNIIPPKSKNIVTISLGLDIIIELCKKSQSCAIKFVKFLYENINIITEKTTSCDSPRNETNLCGLKNCGLTCYINSVLQQIFMIPKFRQFIFNIELEYKEDLNEDVLYQLQKLFVSLQESPDKYCDPTDLIKSIKTSDGGKIQIGIQGDAVEFLQQLFQNLENRLSGTQYEKVLDKIFGSEDISELTAKSKIKDHIYHSFSKNETYMFSVDVQDVTSLEDSLKNYISSSNVEYTWEENNEKETLDTSKRSSLGKCPPTLIIHLKRFTYDNTFTYKKVNSYLSFPFDLDIYPYTVEGRSDEQINVEIKDRDSYLYTLRGIVVHSGSLDGGHYYSYIQSRTSGKWYEFNDSLVSMFNPDNIREECYGKVTDVTSFFNDYAKTAMILFYDQKKYTIEHQKIEFKIKKEEETSLNVNDDQFLFEKLDDEYRGGKLAEKRYNIEINENVSTEVIEHFKIPKTFEDKINNIENISTKINISNKELVEKIFTILNNMLEIENNKEITDYVKKYIDEHVDSNKETMKILTNYKRIMNYCFNSDNFQDNMNKEVKIILDNIFNTVTKDIDNIFKPYIQSFTLPPNIKPYSTSEGSNLAEQSTNVVITLTYKLYKKFKASSIIDIRDIIETLYYLCNYSNEYSKYLFLCGFFDIIIIEIKDASSFGIISKYGLKFINRIIEKCSLSPLESNDSLHSLDKLYDIVFIYIFIVI